VRALALRQGKRVVMAVPRLRAERCFLALDPRRLRGRERTASSIRGASSAGRPLLPDQVPRLDLVVVGSVAVRRDGARVGKGGGFADLEWALLAALGTVGPWTTVVTTVHRLQVVRTAIPMLEHDLPVDYVITPSETIACPHRHPRPRGLVWPALSPAKIAEIPLLQRLAADDPTVTP
jgi:5-formyltetrahydrofolate cyclo-ligase